ncbi:MAG: hypothetical protein KDB27_07410 [Planctomycetales bacterium]|nr:hypothetical protein [Planctomycetales bacterium]
MAQNSGSTRNAFSSFLYGAIVSLLAVLVVLLPFAPKGRETFVVETKLSCVIENLDSKQRVNSSDVWQQIVTPQVIAAAADKAEIFAASVTEDRRRGYLESVVHMESEQADTSESSTAVVTMRHPQKAHAVAMLTTLANTVVADTQTIQLNQTLAANELHSTRPIVHRSGVNTASLELAAPSQVNADQIEQADVDAEVADLRKKLEITKRRHRGLVDVAGANSELALDMGFRVEQLETQLREIEFAQSPAAEMARSSAVEIDPASEYSAVNPDSQFRFVAGPTPPETPSTTWKVRVEVIGAARLVETLPGNVTRTGFLACLGISVLVGCIVGFVCSRSSESPLVTSGADVAKLIISPVIGSVFPTRKKVGAAGQRLGTTGKFLLGTSETIVFAFVAFIVFCMATDRSSAHRFATNPLAEYSASVQRRMPGNASSSESADEACRADKSESV